MSHADDPYAGADLTVEDRAAAYDRVVEALWSYWEQLDSMPAEAAIELLLKTNAALKEERERWAAQHERNVAELIKAKANEGRYAAALFAIRGSDPVVGLSTAEMEAASSNGRYKSAVASLALGDVAMPRDHLTLQGWEL